MTKEIRYLGILRELKYVYALLSLKNLDNRKYWNRWAAINIAQKIQMEKEAAEETAKRILDNGYFRTKSRKQ